MIKIKGREYKTEKVENAGYVLTGPRGATYFAIRIRNNPTQMWVARHNMIDNAFGNLLLTDKDGELKVSENIWYESSAA